MRSLIAILSLTFAVVANANTLEEAQTLFANRGENVANAKKAADIYATLAAKASGVEKANLLLGEAEAIYYVGIKADAKKEKLSLHERGYEAAQKAENLLKASAATKTEIAISNYWFAANIGKWGEAKGVLASLGKWYSDMKPALEEIKDLDDTIQDYGVYRILGMGYLKVPGESNNEGLNYLVKAYTNTIRTVEVDGEELELSYHVNNVVFLLEGMVKEKKLKLADLEFCKIYDDISFLWEAAQEDESILETYNSKLVPESKVEFTNFFAEKDNKEYFDKNCTR
ncbi:hypothetical protein M899_2605 [Bacteriovorax sp. BSW11_IV]|uniref:hypothetical protein n=1 Tax=Bacteriovorax sp. BSW11_IV TaxID=1353529 RepID=UPI00038A1E29|nr:hypothetical protein [Bacteriovorax sp. BSW11_IV]EQC49877.1 hypothetical protein M899_2605 [Bacteriovorax sp. BSW11_IV]